MRDVNYQLLISAARLLQPLLDELVFVGGCVTGLLITDEAVPAARPTLDVDAIVEITSYVGYVNFSERLRDVGFSQDSSEGAPACRWKNGDITLDVMPLNEKILGFSNRWYKAAAEAASLVPLAPLLQIRVITAPYFLATKLEAFRGRGKRDYFGSPDLEDVLSVIDGRPTLAKEVKASPGELRAYLATAISTLLKDSRFIDALPGHLLPDTASQARMDVVLSRLRDLTMS
jgi:hypothetical protein